MSPVTRKCFKITSCITCSTRNVIYMLKCPCQKIYIGKSLRQLKLRISEHKPNIRRQDITSSVARHFNEMGHDIKQLECIGIEEVFVSRRGGNINKELLKREAFWIHKLKSLTPNDMNEELELSVFL